MDQVEKFSYENPSYHAIHDICQNFAEVIQKQNPIPEYIVGLARGGLIPAVMISHMTNIPLFTVHYSSKQGQGDDKNHSSTLPMLPFHYISGTHDKFVGCPIVIVDDICDSGHTLKEVVDFYQFHRHDVFSITLYYKERSNPVVTPDLHWRSIPEDFGWVNFPWEK